MPESPAVKSHQGLVLPLLYPSALQLLSKTLSTQRMNE